MARTTPNTILLTVNGAERPVFEGEADEALTPGELVRWDTDDELELHGTASGVSQKMFVLENPFAPDPATPAIDQDWAIGDSARYIYAQSGDLVYAFLAASQTAVKGSPLGSDGAGSLAVITPGAGILEGAIVAYADEDLTTSGARARIRARVA